MGRDKLRSLLEMVGYGGREDRVRGNYISELLDALECEVGVEKFVERAGELGKWEI